MSGQLNLKVETRRLAELPGVYALAPWRRHGRRCVAAASESCQGQCQIIDLDLGGAEKVWTGPGGTMSVVPIGEDRFFAVQRFFPGFDSEASIVVEGNVSRTNGAWEVTERLRLPYLHRLGAAGGNLLAATLCAGKTHPDDWAKPGAVCRIPTAGPNAWEPIEIIGGIHRNHGFSITSWRQQAALLISGKDGLFAIPLHDGASGPAWSHEHLLTHDVSDVVAFDWDGDGEEELLTIEPFHGNRFTFYDQRQGQLQVVHAIECNLGHSLWAGSAFGQAVLILGERNGRGRIMLVLPGRRPPSEWQTFVVAEDTGGTNVAVVSATPHELSFVSANTDHNEVMWYRVRLEA